MNSYSMESNTNYPINKSFGQNIQQNFVQNSHQNITQKNIQNIPVIMTRSPKNRKSSYQLKNNQNINFSNLTMQFEGLCNFSIFLRACTPFILNKNSEKIVKCLLKI